MRDEETRLLTHVATQFVAAPPDEVFALITTPERLPEWNAAIVGVVNAPEHMAPGSEWVAQLTAMRQSWESRATVLEHDPYSRHFAYRSQTDDGNPSYADWSWQVTDAPLGCEVAVTFALHPVTFWRRVLFARIRASQLRRREIPASLRTLATTAAAAVER
jgi:uncharacterized protein YndB with AHSA1/START domain